jgi:chromosome segregation ATPase
MPLLLASLEDFKFILQIVSWIAIPALLIATGIVYFLHYQKQKKEAAARLRKLEATNADINLSIVHTDEMHPMQDLSYEGEQLIKKYRKEIKVTTAKYDVLKREFTRLEEKYMELMAKSKSGQLQITNGADNDLDHSIIQQYETKIAELEQALKGNGLVSYNSSHLEDIIKQKEDQLFQREMQMNELENELKYYTNQSEKLHQELETLRNEATGGVEKDASELQGILQQQLKETEKTYKKEITGLLLQIEKSNQEIHQLKTNNQQTIAQIRTQEYSATEGNNQHDDLYQRLNRLEQEKVILRNRLTEENYLQDLLQEKNEHINFLQAQLEQRIKNYRQLEQQHLIESESIKTMDEVLKKHDQELTHLKATLREKDTDIIGQQERLIAAAAYAEEQEKKLQAKTAQLEQFKQEEEEMRQNANLLQTDLVSSHKIIGNLNSTLSDRNQKMEDLEKQLDISSQLLIKIYKELARSFGTNILNNIGQEKISDREANGLLYPSSSETPQAAFKEQS